MPYLETFSSPKRLFCKQMPGVTILAYVAVGENIKIVVNVKKFVNIFAL